MRIFASIALSVLCIAGAAAMDLSATDIRVIATQAATLQVGQPAANVTVTIGGRQVVVTLVKNAKGQIVASGGISASFIFVTLGDGTLAFSVSETGQATQTFAVTATGVTPAASMDVLIAAHGAPAGQNGNGNGNGGGVQGGGGDGGTLDLSDQTGPSGGAQSSVAQGNANTQSQITNGTLSPNRP